MPVCRNWAGLFGVECDYWVPHPALAAQPMLFVFSRSGLLEAQIVGESSISYSDSTWGHSSLGLGGLSCGLKVVRGENLAWNLSCEVMKHYQSNHGSWELSRKAWCHYNCSGTSLGAPGVHSWAVLSQGICSSCPLILVTFTSLWSLQWHCNAFLTSVSFLGQKSVNIGV